MACSRKKLCSITCSILVSLVLSSVQNAHAENICELILNTYVVEPSAHQIKVHYSLHVLPVAALADLLRDGAHLALEEQVSVVRLRSLMPNSTVLDARFVWYLRHDPLTRQFILTQDNGQSSRNAQLAPLLAQTWKERSHLFPLERPLEEDSTFRLVLSYTFKHTEVPPWLEKSLFFWSWGVSEPLVVSVDFITP